MVIFFVLFRIGICTTLEGQRGTEWFEGLLAAIFHHEYNHLEGNVCLVQMEDWTHLVTEREFKRLQGQKQS